MSRIILAAVAALVALSAVTASAQSTPRVSFQGAPSAHGGDAFKLSVFFRDETDYVTQYAQMRDTYTQVDGGTLTRVKRIIQSDVPRNSGWYVSIRPDNADDDVTVTVRGVGKTILANEPVPASVPAKPTGFTASGGTDEPDWRSNAKKYYYVFSFEWNTVDNATSYEIQRTWNGSWAKVSDVTISGNRDTLTFDAVLLKSSFGENDSVRFRIIAKNGAGSSAASDEATIIVNRAIVTRTFTAPPDATVEEYRSIGLADGDWIRFRLLGADATDSGNFEFLMSTFTAGDSCDVEFDVVSAPAGTGTNPPGAGEIRMGSPDNNPIGWDNRDNVTVTFNESNDKVRLSNTNGAPIVLDVTVDCS